MMVGSAACIAASSIACVGRRCAARSRARLELPARGDKSHTRAPGALLMAAKTDVDPDPAFCGLHDFECGGSDATSPTWRVSIGFPVFWDGPRASFPTI